MEMWFSEFHTPDVKHSIRVNRQLYSKQSDYQRLSLIHISEPTRRRGTISASTFLKHRSLAVC